eukprot:COSAG06_NODE_267_length_18822_cov_26.254607_6_plen_142_part_00
MQTLVTVRCHSLAVRAHRGRVPHLDATCTSVRRALEYRENTAARHIQPGILRHSMDRAHGCDEILAHGCDEILAHGCDEILARGCDETSSVHCGTAWTGRTGVMKYYIIIINNNNNMNNNNNNAHMMQCVLGKLEIDAQPE